MESDKSKHLKAKYIVMTNIRTTFFLLLLNQFAFGQNDPLFSIVEQNKIGYINIKGEMVIKPVFLDGNDFSEGHASVRLNGRYGFIDKTGHFVIKPSFDLASNFINGIAIVYKEGTPYIINKSGEEVLSTNYRGLYFIDKKTAIVFTKSGKQGLLEITTGKLIADTIYSEIGAFNLGVTIVKEYLPKNKRNKDKESRVGIIDSTGKVVIPFGKYNDIKPFNEGYALVKITNSKDKDSDIDGVIDTKGSILFTRECKNNSYIQGNFNNGLAVINLYKFWIPEKKGIYSSSEKVYQGFINLKGEVVLNDTNHRYVNDFSNHRAFLQNESQEYVIIDTKLNLVGKQRFLNIKYDRFQNGFAIVETHEGWGIIDTTGNFVVKPKFEDIDEVGIIDNYFFFFIEDENNNKLYGIADITNKIITQPILQYFDRKGFVNGLIKVLINNRLAYINKNGDIIWHGRKDTSATLQKLNIDFMNRGYFYAYSSGSFADTGHDSGGWATSANVSKKIDKEMIFDKNKLILKIDTNSKDIYAERFLGIKLFIANATGDTVRFNAQDSRLNLKLQAQNPKGDWKDIEYLPSSWCGNSYHQIDLEPNAYWGFTIPSYEGEFNTNIRAELKYIDNKNPKKDKVIYSNIINGSINPGQFWNKIKYFPNGLMDPYND